MIILAGQTPLALRQSGAMTFAGVEPKNGTTVYEPSVNADTKIIQYADPDNIANITLTAGGLYDFGDQTVAIREVRALTAIGDLTLTVGDRGDTDHDHIVATPAPTRIAFSTALVILPSQVLKIASAGSNAKGFIDVYIVKGDWF